MAALKIFIFFSSLFAADNFNFETYPESLYYSLRPPILKVGKTLDQNGENTLDYIKEIYNLTLKYAKINGENLKAIDIKAYDAFLWGALLVPFHESRWMHFRKPNLFICNDGLQTGNFIINRYGENSDPYKAFIETFKMVGPYPLWQLKSCDGLKNEITEFKDNSATQLLGSFDLLSVGMFQVAMKFHLSYTRGNGHLSIEETIKYGVNLYYKGFYELWKKRNDFPCLWNGVDLNYFNLILGAWSGNYNSGKIENSCRMDDPNDRWHQNDVSFIEDSKLILALSDFNKKSFYPYLPEELKINFKNLSEFINGYFRKR